MLLVSCSRFLRSIHQLSWTEAVPSRIITRVLGSFAYLPRPVGTQQCSFAHSSRVLQNARSFDQRDRLGLRCVKTMVKRKADAEEAKPKKAAGKQSKSKKAEAEDDQENGDGEPFASGDLVTPTTRVRQLKPGTPGKGPVIYW